MVDSNKILYANGEKPDHCIVIKYVPFVGDSKRAMDEYTSEIMLGGRSTIVIHNTCEDSLLAAPIILDLVILAELCQRITYRVGDETSWHHFHSVLSILSYLCKAPLVPAGTPVVNSLFRQRACLENIFRACLGLAPINNMMLEHKLDTISYTTSTAKVNMPASVVNGSGDYHHANGKAAAHKAIKKGAHTACNGHTTTNGVTNGDASHDEYVH